MCYHMFVDGFGGMGDAVVCVKCDFSKYPEALPWFNLYKYAGRIIKNTGNYMHFGEFPYVRKFPCTITFGIDMNAWTHYFNREGKLVEREDK